MTSRLQFILFCIVAGVATVDAAWVRAGHFDVDLPGFAGIAVLTVVCASAGLFYERVRKEERLAAMLLGTSFLLGMSSSFSLLNYLLLTVAGQRIDAPLAALDRALGVDWPAMMSVAAEHPIISAGLQLAYISVLPQIAVLVALLGWRGKYQNIYALCLSLTAGAAISIFIWTLAPSFGAFSVYELPANFSRHLALALDAQYAKDLVGLLAHGPGHISPTSAKGLIGFPSFHAFAGIREEELFDHVVDVIAGFAVAALGVLFANVVMRSTSRPALAVEPTTASV